ncbi:MAG: hypothetical protein H5U07_04035 [Candidatus Aminicenantes bacterium]|nr:hypothetical protein [Candidatus Aminicenantes bacterium]
MWWLMEGVGFIVRLLLLPFSRFNPWLGLLFISLLTSLFLLFVYKKISNQEKIKQTKNQIKAHFLEMRLFQHDYRILLQTQKNLLLANLRYLTLNLKPLLVMIIPLFLLLAQLNLWFGYRNFSPGETFLLKVRLTPSVEVDRAFLDLEAAPGLEVETPVLRIVDENEADWRIKVRQPVEAPLLVIINGEKYWKEIPAGFSSLQKLSPVRAGQNLWLQLLYPGEKPLPDGAYAEKIEITLPEYRLSFLGIRWHWLVAYFLLSIIFALALKRFLKVEI